MFGYLYFSDLSLHIYRMTNTILYLKFKYDNRFKFPVNPSKFEIRLPRKCKRDKFTKPSNPFRSSILLYPYQILIQPIR